MSFFKDFKDDLSQAVDELMPGEELLEDEEFEGDSDVMVNTLDGELDIESELSKLDGLLEPVTAKKTPVRPEPQQRARMQEPRPERTRIAKEPVRREMSSPVRPQTVNTAKVKEENLNLMEFDAVQPQKTTMRGANQEGGAPEFEEVRPVRNVPVKEPVRAHETMQERNVRKMTEKPPVMQNTYRNDTNQAMNKSNAIKEEKRPMNEDMTKETTVSFEDELSSVSPEVTDEVSIITEGTTIKGNLQTTGSFSISGTIEGNVQCNGKLEVTGAIKGNSSSSEIFADAAKIEGEITSTGTVKIGLGSVVVGNITATSAVIAGAVKGDIDVQGPVVVDTSAVIVGNIKSRSVQINNGAVIEGFCSQCYADVDVDTLFGNKKGN